MAVDNRNFVNSFANEGGADVLVEDKRMDELKSATAKTSSQISTSAQYIPLQDTDGNLVKINPASFEEAVRNVLGTLLANNDKGTTISAVPAFSGSGASLDFGSVSPANLASVLGVIPPITNAQHVPFTDLDTLCSDNGIYAITDNSTNAPAQGYLFVYVWKNRDTVYTTGSCLQLIISNNTSEIYYRYGNGSIGSMTFGNWVKITGTFI